MSENLQPAPATPADLNHLAPYAGAFQDGYDEVDIDTVLSGITGAELVCVWEGRDECGPHGHSQIIGRVGEGPWRELHPDLWDYLTNPGATLPQAPPLLSATLYHAQDVHSWDQIGSHNRVMDTPAGTLSLEDAVTRLQEIRAACPDLALRVLTVDDVAARMGKTTLTGTERATLRETHAWRKWADMGEEDWARVDAAIEEITGS